MVRLTTLIMPLLIACEGDLKVDGEATQSLRSTTSPAGEDFLISAPSTANTGEQTTVSWTKVTNADSYNLNAASAFDSETKICSSSIIQLDELEKTSQKITFTQKGTYYICVSANLADGSIVYASDTGFKIEVGIKKETTSTTSSDPSLVYSSNTQSGIFGSAMTITPTTASGGDGTISSCAEKTSGSLPSGLSVNSTTCVVSGTPTAVKSSTTITIVLTNSKGETAEGSFTIYVGPETVTVSAAYSNAAGWMDYIRTSDYTTVCDASEAARSACTHGGEARKVTTSQTSCTGLTASDNRGAFDWTCAVTGGYATFTSALKYNKGLKDLIDGSAYDWLTNYVTVLNASSETIAQSSAAKWWSASDNTITNLTTQDSSSSAVTLSASGTIYVLSSNYTSYGYNINTDKTAIVVMDSYTITAHASIASNTATLGDAGANLAALISSNNNFIWFEGALNGNSNAAQAIYFVRSKFSMIRGFTITGSKEAGLHLYRAFNFNQIVNGTITNPENYGVLLGNESSEPATQNLFNYVTISGAATAGAYGYYTNGTTWQNMTVSSSGADGIYSRSSSNVVIDTNTVSNHTYNIRGNAADALVIKNNKTYTGSNGIYLGGSATTGPKIYNHKATNHYAGTCFSIYMNNAYIVNNFCSNAYTGIYNYSNENNTIVNFTVINVDRSLHTGANNHTYHNITAVNGGYGYLGYEKDSFFSNVVVANSAWGGFYASSTNYSEFHNIWSSNNSGYGFSFANAAASNNAIYKTLYVGSNSTNECFSHASSTGNNIDSGATACTESDANLTVVTGKDISGTIVWKDVITDDSSNGNTASLTSGTIDYSSITDWTTFDSDFRLWSQATNTTNANIMDTSNRNRKNSGNFSVRDMRLLSTDTQLRNIHGAWANDGTCPASVAAANELTDRNGTETSGGDSDGNCEVGETCSGTNTYLITAFEVVLDSVGDDDGLCESNETCIYSPNLGHYQGHGTYTDTTSCTYNGTGVTGVTLYAYPTNGI